MSNFWKLLYKNVMINKYCLSSRHVTEQKFLIALIMIKASKNKQKLFQMFYEIAAMNKTFCLLRLFSARKKPFSVEIFIHATCTSRNSLT